MKPYVASPLAGHVIGVFPMIRALLLLSTLLTSLNSHAQLNVVATVSNMAMLASTVGGNQVRVTTLAPPDRDAHHLEVRPAMMVALRQADLLVAVGGELEIGWLPPAIQGARNPAINPGRPAHFEAAAQVQLIDPVPDADRSMGDVHAAGNPHVYMDPLRLAQVGLALADTLALLAPEHAEQFQHNARQFAEQIEQRLSGWQQQVEHSPGVLLFHADANYLTKRLNVPVLGYLEPMPGIPPTGKHLATLVNQLRHTSATLIMPTYQSPRAARFIERELGWPIHWLPTQVAIGADADAYMTLIDHWVSAMAPQ
jgi:zinc/manganese transport system substrate-binding protein